MNDFVKLINSYRINNNTYKFKLSYRNNNSTIYLCVKKICENNIKKKYFRFSDFDLYSLVKSIQNNECFTNEFTSDDNKFEYFISYTYYEDEDDILTIEIYNNNNIFIPLYKYVYNLNEKNIEYFKKIDIKKLSYMFNISKLDEY